MEGLRVSPKREYCLQGTNTTQKQSLIPFTHCIDLEPLATSLFFFYLKLR